jgi:hypothetical protein
MGGGRAAEIPKPHGDIRQSACLSEAYRDAVVAACGGGPDHWLVTPILIRHAQPLVSKAKR